MADSAFQGETGAVKGVMRRLQRGSHKRGRAASTARRASSISKVKAAGKQKGEARLDPEHACCRPLWLQGRLLAIRYPQGIILRDIKTAGMQKGKT